MVKTRSLYLTWARFATGSWHPGRTDGGTDRIAHEDLDEDLDSIQDLMQNDPTTLKDTISAAASLL